MALKRAWIPSPCYSGGNVTNRRIAVMHTAEGARTYEDLGHFFQNPANQVSSHVGIDDTRGIIGEYVTRGNSAWTVASYNPYAVSAELCGFASWTRDQWINQHHNMLLNAADWWREECSILGLPLDRLNDTQAQGNGHGCCEHINLGAGGGGHVDCGPGFPIDYVLDLARGTPAKELDLGGIVFYLDFDNSGSAPVVFTNGEADGKHRLRVFCNRTCKVEIDLRTVTESFDLGYSNGPQGLKIPSGVKCGVIRWVNKPDDDAQVAAVISESS